MSRKTTLIVPEESKLTPVEQETYHREFEKWRKTVEPLVKATRASQHLTAKDLSLTVTI